MAPSLRRSSIPIDPAQLKLIYRFLFNLDDGNREKDDSADASWTNDEDSSLWEDVDEETAETTSENDTSGENLDTQSAGSIIPKRTVQKLENSSATSSSTTSWLQKIHTATIPSFEFWVFAHERRIWAMEFMNGGDEQWKTVFRKEMQSEISALTCLPVTPTRMSDPRPYEWTAVLIGFEDGRFIALNEHGTTELINYRFHTKPIIELRQQFDQLYVAYPDYLVVVGGLTLLTTLKTNRQRILRQHRGLEHQHSLDQLSIESQLVHEFWKLENVSQPTTIAASGPRRTSMWEKMATASVKGGFNANISNRQPSYETYCSTNTKNFVSFNWWTDETQPNLLAGLANRLKSTVSVPSIFTDRLTSWWSPSSSSRQPSGGSKPSDPSSAPPNPITSRDVPQRSHLPDVGRIGERLITAPGDRLAAICDDLGRVSLIDVHRRSITRMWKGYRDAQCAWIELPYSAKGEKDDDDQSSRRCNVLCLVIYAPRRGILEIWSAQNGRRVGAFNVDRRGMLVYCPPTALTKANSIDYSQSTRFLDSRGVFYRLDISSTIVIEPHETSTYWTTPAKEDFRKGWSGNLVDEAQLNFLIRLLGRIVWAKDIGFLIDHVLSSTKLDYKLFVRFIESVLARLAKDQDPQHADVRSMFAHCSAYRQITNVVALIAKYHDVNYRSSDDGDDVDMEKVHETLALQSADELNGFLNDLDENLRIRFSTMEIESKPMDASKILKDFLSAIDYRALSHVPFTPSPSSPTSPALSEHTLKMRFKKDLVDENGETAMILAELGDFVFKPFVDGTCSMDEFRRTIQPLLGLTDRDWIRLFCSYWLHKNRQYSVHPLKLYELFNAISSKAKGELGNEFLREIRRSILDCSRIAEALALCMVVRGTIRNTSKEKADSEWTSVERDVEDWDILQTALHSLLLVDTCCKYVAVDIDGNRASKKQKSTKTTAADDTTRKYRQIEPISLRRLLTTGPGFLCEYVAESFVTADRPIDTNRLNNKMDGGDGDSAATKWSSSLDRARELLPLSLETERLLLGALWEYVRVWHKSPRRIECLERANALLIEVQDERLRQGFASLAWRTFFRQHYEKLCTAMMCSHGKDCSEQVEREIGLPASGLLDFARFVYSLFNVMQESVERYQEGATKKYETEEFLTNFFSAFRRDVASTTSSTDERNGGGGSISHHQRESLWDVLTRQPPNSKNQIRLHWQLTASILVAISTNFETRLTPLNLFSWDQRSDLFKTISISEQRRGATTNKENYDDEEDEHALSDDDGEKQQLDNRRLLFLLSYVTEAIKSSLPSISSSQSDEDTDEQSEESKNLLPDLSLAVKLARAWGLNFDAVRRQEVVQLYLAGYPNLASKLLPLVEDRRQLASTLLDIAGCALSDRWTSDPTTYRPNMSAQMWRWLTARKSSTNARGPELNLEACSSMLAFVSSTMSHGSNEFKISDELRAVIEKS